MLRNILVGILSCAVSLAAKAAEPPIYIQFTDGSSDFARRFISTSPGDYYGLPIITRVVTAGPPKYNVEERVAKFDELKSIDLVGAKKPHIYPELDWMYGGARTVYQVTLLDGSKMESVGSTLYNYTDGLSFAIRFRLAKSAPLDAQLRYEDVNGQTKLVRDRAIQRIILNDPDAVAEELRKAQLLKAEQARQQEIARVSVERFRSKIKIGTDINCGPVLEIKGHLVKVYAPVQGYGNEHWLRLSETFPPSYSCEFLNGRYTAPTFAGGSKVTKP